MREHTMLDYARTGGLIEEARRQEELYFDEHEREEAEFFYSSEAECDREQARLLGEARPEQAWISTSRDAWHPNPYYKGPPVPHPESDEALGLWDAAYEEHLVEEAMSLSEPVYTSEYGYEDAAPDEDIPF